MGDILKLAMSIKEASESLTLGESTIRKMVREGTFPKPFYVGDSPRFKVDDIKNWMNSPPPAKKKAGRPRLVI